MTTNGIHLNLPLELSNQPGPPHHAAAPNGSVGTNPNATCLSGSHVIPEYEASVPANHVILPGRIVTLGIVHGAEQIGTHLSGLQKSSPQCDNET